MHAFQYQRGYLQMGKRKTTLWDLLIWVYRDQNTETVLTVDALRSRPHVPSMPLMGADIVDSSVHLGTKVHDDAFAVDLGLTAIAGCRDVKHRAKLASLPEAVPVRRPLSVKPDVIKANGMAATFGIDYHGKIRSCRLKYDGDTDDGYEVRRIKSAENFMRFHEVCSILYERLQKQELIAWELAGLGYSLDYWFFNEIAA